MSLVAVVLSLAALGVAIATLIVVVAMRREVDSRSRRVEAWNTLHLVLDLPRPLPWPRPWSASPELLRVIVEGVFEKKPDVVLELGSGSSTLVTAYALKKVGRGRIVSLDHDAEYAQKTRDLVASHGLSDIVEVVHAPLREVTVGGTTRRWYDVDALRRTGARDASIVVVDGPPGMDQKLARYPAVPLLREFLRDDVLVIVDDARRADEQEMVRRWVAEDGTLESEYLTTEKGTILVRRKRR